jgi:transcriptional regulator GlxA family with amidase domain
MVLHDPIMASRLKDDQDENGAKRQELTSASRMKSPAADVTCQPQSKRPGAPTEVGDMLDGIERDVEQNPGTALAAASRLVTLLTEMAAARSPAARGGLAPWQKRKLEQHLKQQPSELHRVNELAQHVSLSVSHFYRAFRQTFGETPRAYILRMKLDHAKERMLATNDSLVQIALASGFADQSDFCKIFRRVVGDTPAAWRRRRLS